MALADIRYLDNMGRPGRPDNSLPKPLPIPNPPPGTPGHLPAVPPGWPVIPSHPIVRWPRPGEPDNSLPKPNPPPDKPGHLPSVPVGWPVIPAHPIETPEDPVDPGYGVDEGDQDKPPVDGPITLPGKPPVAKPGETIVIVRHNGKWQYAVIPAPSPPMPTPV